jgi:hypothetical protein
MTRLVDFCKGLFALTVTLGLVAGVPVALVVLLGDPATGIWAAATDPLVSDNQRVTELLRHGLAVIAWLAWAQVAWAIMVETVALARGRAATPRPLVLPGVQGLARRLVVSSTLIAGLLNSAPAGAATLAPLTPLGTPPPTYHATTTLTAPDPDPATGPVAVLTPSPDEDRATFHTDKRETFWSIAEQTLGDGRRWPEIRALNLGRTNPAGTVITDRTETIEAGWDLVLPADATPTHSTPLTATTEAETTPAGAGQATPTPDPTPTSASTTETDTPQDDARSAEVDLGDHLWSLAFDELADNWGREPTDEELTPYWAAMVELNHDLLLPPGDPDVIYPGQHLLIPPPPPDPTGSTTPHADDLDQLATQDLATEDDVTPEPGATPPDTAEAPADTATPDEAATNTDVSNGTDPGQVTPDEHATSTNPPGEPTDPATTIPDATDSSGNAGLDELWEQHADTSDDDATIDPRTRPADVVGQATDPVAVPTATPSTEQAAVDPALNSEPVSADTEELPRNWVPTLIASSAALTAAAVLRIVYRRRAQSVGRRRPGQAPRFQPPARARTLLASLADDDLLDDLDHALRTIAATTGLDHLPVVVGVLTNTDSIRLLLDEPALEPPEVFHSEDGGMVWTINRADIAPVDAEAPYPALVTLGHDDRFQVMVDLEYVGTLTITGAPEDVVDTMATMALELATTPMAGTIDVICVGFGHELDDLERVTVIDTLDDITERVTTQAAETAALIDHDATDAPHGRIAGTGGDSWTPLVVFDPHSPTADLDDLLDAATATIRSGVIAVVSTAESAHWSVRVTNSDITVPAMGITRQRRNFDTDERVDIVTAITDATHPDLVDHPDLVADITTNPAITPVAPSPRPGPPPWPEPDTTSSDNDDTTPQTTPTTTAAGGEGSLTPPDTANPAAESVVEPETGGDIDPVVDVIDLWDLAPTTDVVEIEPAPPTPTDLPPWNYEAIVTVLGPIQILDRDGERIRFVRSSTTEMIAYLVQHRAGVTVDATMEALLPYDTTKKRTWINNLSSDARKGLGNDPDGNPLLPRTVNTGGLFRISPLVTSDIERLTQLVHHARTQPVPTAIQTLSHALDLVNGMPYTGLSSNWAQMEGIYTETILTVDEAARTLATLALDETGDPDLADWATKKGLLANPRSQELHLLRLRSATVRDDPLAVDAVFQHFRTVMLADEDHPEGSSELDSRIVDLYEQYRRSRPMTWVDASSA